MLLSELKEVYQYMEKAKQAPEHKDTVLSVKILEDKYFDQESLELLLQNDENARKDVLDQFQSTIQELEECQQGGNTFLRNVKSMVHTVTSFIARQLQPNSESYGSINQIANPSEITLQQNGNTLLIEILNKYVVKSIKNDDNCDNNAQITETVAKSIHYKLLDPTLCQVFLDSLQKRIDTDVEFFSKSTNEKIYPKIKSTVNLIKIINSILNNNQHLTEKLFQYSFLYFQKSLKYFEISATPMFLQFMIKLLKQQKDESGWQLDLMQKNKIQQYLKEMFEVVAYNLHKANITQIFEFCHMIKHYKYLGFDVLSSINFYSLIHELHYNFGSFLAKVLLQKQQLQQIDVDHPLLQELFLIEQKFNYILKSMEDVFVTTFYHDDSTSKASNEKRIHLIVSLWNQFFEGRGEMALQEYFKQIAQVMKMNLVGNHKEEQLLKRISFLRLANTFLLRDKLSETSFSSSVIIDLVLPKLNLCQTIQQVIMWQNKQDKPNMLTVQYMIKRLYQFHLNLLANTKDKQLREKALKELSKSISLFFEGEDVFSQSKLKHGLLDYIALKIQNNYFQCDTHEQIQFFIEIMTVINSQLYKIEDEFLVQVQQCKGTLKGMQNLSLFRQIMQKAQGQNYQNMSIGSILEKKVIDYKRVFQVIPLLAKCCQIFNDTQFTAKLRVTQLLSEFWIYVTLNNPAFFLPNKNVKKQHLTNEEGVLLTEQIQPFHELYRQMWLPLNQIAFYTPNLLAGTKSSLLDLKIVMMLVENKNTFTYDFFHFNSLARQMKVLFKIKKKELKDKHLEPYDLVYIVMLNDILQRSQAHVVQDIKELQKSEQSYINKFLNFVKSSHSHDEDEQLQNKEISGIQLTHQQLRNQLNKQIKFQSLLKESVTRAAVQYTLFLLNSKGTLTKDVICRDFVYLIQQSCSIERTLSEYASDMVFDFIRNFPFVCFSPEVIKMFSHLLTIIYQKIGREYDSKSKQVANEQYNRVMLHTDQKVLTQNIIFLMNCLLKLIFRGLYIDHNFVKVFCLHLIRQETSLLSELPFGYKFLKFLISSFKVDKDAIEAFKDQADRYNPYFWLVKEVEFDNKISTSDMSTFISDKGLLRLQKINIEQRVPYQTAQEILKLITYSIKNEIEFDFHADDHLYINYQSVLKEIARCCQELNIIHFIYNNKPQAGQKLKDRLKALKIKVRDSSQYRKVKQEIVKEMLMHVTSLRSVIIHSGSQIKNQIITQLLDICKFFLQPQLLKYILMRLIPFLHSISPNYFDSTFFFLLGEMLHYIINQINNLGNLKYDKKISSQDIFQIKTNYFNSLQDLEIEEFTDVYLSKLDEPYLNFINLAQIGYYEVRWKCLCKLHLILIRFLNDNMQIHLVKNVKLSIIANILKHNFMTDRKLVEFIPLENVCQVLKGSIEIIQLMKEFKEKFKNTQDIVVNVGQQNSLHQVLISRNLAVKFNIESFYYKTLKFGLSHFAKNVNLYNEPLFIQCSNQARLMKKFQLYCMVCKYLAKDKLNELNEDSKIPKLKRVKKRFNSMIFKSHRQFKLAPQGSKDTSETRASILMQGYTSQMYRRLQAEIGYNGQQTYAISLQKQQESKPLEVRPYYLRKALFFLLCDELDKIKAFASKLQEELQTDYSLLGQNKLSDNFIQQILSEIPDKNLNLAYQILLKLYPIMQTEVSLNEVFYKFLGHKISVNLQNYLDCSHFFDIVVTHNLKHIENYLKTLLYWKPPHIQVLLKYITDTFENFPDVQLCFSKIMKRLHSEQIIFYLPQILQSLASRSGQLIKAFLIEYAQQSVLFAHQLLWLARVESKIDTDHKRPPSPKNKHALNVLHTPEYQQFVSEQVEKGIVQPKQYLISKVTPYIIAKVIRNMDSEQTAFFKKVDGFYESVTAISGILRPQMPKPEKRDIIARELQKIPLSSDIYMPTNPRYQITAIKLDSGTPMQSAAKCPILVSFYCRKYEGPDKYFERKLKEKREFDKTLESEVTKKLREEEIQRMILLFESDPLPDDEEKGQLFINELVRPLKGVGQNMSMSMQSNMRESRVHRQQEMQKSLVKLPTPRSSIRKQTTMNNQETQELKSCIFKVFDDIRQDNLALQIINMFKGVFERCGLDLFVFPYKTISNRTGKQLNVGGIIEVIPNTISRDQLGKTNRCTLYEYFINKFGAEDTIQFQIARENFIKSQAAYSIISYILQIKDRHNGNILISDKGHIIHIDFGFIFDISPGGNLKFESANFKLTKEMSQIMGGEAFKYYVDLTVRAFLAIRHYYEHFYYLVTLMINSGLGCFMKDSMKNFTDRFQVQVSLSQLKKNDLAAAKYMQTIVEDANDKLTTRLYDDIQYYQNGISR